MGSPIDFTTTDSHLLVNSRSPTDVLKQAEILKNELSAFPGHVAIGTSGTTASPACSSKWVLLSKEALLCSAQAVNSHLQSTSSDVWLHALPDFHVGGLGIWARAFLSEARVVKFEQPWSPHRYVSYAEMHQATLSSLVPTQVYDLVFHSIQAPKSLRAIVVGGGELPIDLYQKARALNWNLLPSYGMSECASQIATAPLLSLASKKTHLELLPHVEAKVSSEGVLCLKSPALLTAYAYLIKSGVEFRDPKQQGWFESDDCVSLEGLLLNVLGRQHDFFKIGGESVHFKKLDMLLQTLKLKYKINAELVILPDDRLGNAVYLTSVQEEEKNEAVKTMISVFNEQVYPFERIRACLYVDTIPRSPMGKVLRSVLVQMALAKKNV